MRYICKESKSLIPKSYIIVLCEAIESYILSYHSKFRGEPKLSDDYSNSCYIIHVLSGTIV